MIFLVTLLSTAVLSFVMVPIGLLLASAFGLYVVVEERRAVVYELFGKVRAVIDEPGLHSPLFILGPLAVLVPLFGKKHIVDQRLDQTYLRSQGVNSEEGAPMGVGVWSEMVVVDPVAYLFKNADPRGSLQANVSNAKFLKDNIPVFKNSQRAARALYKYTGYYRWLEENKEG